ncbi:MAG: glycosyltransferase family 39 protein, partial [Chloroflexota bacterium]
MSFNRVGWWLGDALLLIALATYILVGVPLAVFHGDEGMQVYATIDYFEGIVDGDLGSLTTSPPYPIDSRAHLRIINGNAQRFIAGAVLHARGHNPGDLPLEPGWNWGLSYADNVDGGWLPKNSVLYASRYTSAAFFALSLIPIYGLGRLLGGRLVAYSALIFYAFTPPLLLNARRAMMEGTMLFFGLLTVWIGFEIIRRRQSGQIIWIWLAALALSGGLALASKHTGAVFLVVTWLVLGIDVLLRREQWLGRLSVLVLTGVGALVVFIGFSPALWSNPPARLADLARLRSELLTIQVSIEDGAPMAFTQRAAWVVIQPLNAPPQYFERLDWGTEQDIAQQVEAYESSRLAGLPTWVGLRILLGILCVLGIFGLRALPVSYSIGVL